MTTYAQAITDLRSRLDEKGIAHYWADTDLLNWLVLGCRNIATRTETLVEYSTGIVAFPGLGEYPWPTDALRLHRVEYVPANSSNPPNAYPLELATVYEMDQRWGSQQYQQAIYPSYAVVGRGTPGNPRNNGSGVPVFQVYPVPSQSGYFRVWYYALPKLSPLTTDNLEVSLGYEELPVFYAEAMAFRADKDPRWQESMQLYEGGLVHMIEFTRTLHDQSQQMTWGNSMSAWGALSTGWGGY